MKNWKPSASQKRAFAEKMEDSEFAAAYSERKKAKAGKRKASSSFDYPNAGGMYIPTKVQDDAAWEILALPNVPEELANSAKIVEYGYSCNEKVPHDDIHTTSTK